MRRNALPAPGGISELLDLVARLHAGPLDHLDDELGHLGQAVGL